MLRKILLLQSLLIFSLGCSGPKISPEKKDSVRNPSEAGFVPGSCDEFNAKSADKKMEILYGMHLESAANHSANTFTANDLGYPAAAFQYTQAYINNEVSRIEFAHKAIKATLHFLRPRFLFGGGYQSLKPTLARPCDILETPQVKMVHAIGTLAKAHMNIFASLIRLDDKDEPAGEVLNPWTGLFKAHTSVDLLMRFSIANPVGLPISLRGHDFGPEFIPGLGLKFFINRRENVNLLAMESLAGQSVDGNSDENYFLHEFSPDFSAKAPPAFNTSTGAERPAILKRYGNNVGNRIAMELVGKRFYQQMEHYIPDFSTYEDQKVKNPKQSIRGPNPFILSLSYMSRIEKDGHMVDSGTERQPWRLVFKPALDNIRDTLRKDAVTDSTPYAVGRFTADFRYKLAHLQKNDRVYYVIAEMQDKRRYRLGEIILDSSPIPSDFSDLQFFVRHDIELARVGQAPTITSPEP